MDGDERRSGGTAVCDIATGDEAEASGDAAPVPAADGPDEQESAADMTVVAEPEATAEPVEPALDEVVVQAETISDGPEPDGSVSNDSGSDDSVSDDSVSDDSVSDDSVSDDSDTGDSVSDDSEPDDSPSDEQADLDDAAEPEAVDDAEAVAATSADTPVVQARRRPFLRRGLLALAVAGFVALGVGAFSWIAPSPGAADQRFVDAARSQGHDVVDGEQQSLVVSAARKICDRRNIHDTDQERRATALTTDEISAVGAAFGADTRDFTTLALETYCSS